MNENNLILRSLQEEIFNVDKESNIPSGYLKVELSTKGKLRAPAFVHVRNFKVKDIISLSLTSEQDLPQRLIQILNEAIYEDVDVGEWHEKEVEELMFNIFATFYKSKLTDVAFPYNEEDLNFLRSSDDVTKELYDGIMSKEWTPRTTIDLNQDVAAYELPENFNPQITITNKKTGFSVTFDYIKYRDQIIIRKWIDKIYKNETFKFKKIEEQLNYNERLMIQSKEDPEVLSKLIPIDPVLEDEYKEYLAKKLQTALEVVRIISISNFDGEDVSKLSIDEKYERFANDARIDYGMITKLEKRQSKQLIGLKPEVSMWNPIKNERCFRRFSFRIPSIIQAVQLLGDSDYDDGYDDEDEYNS